MSKQRGKTYEIIFPDKHVEIIQNLSQFCKDNGLDFEAMGRVARGKRKTHKEYQLKIIDHGVEYVSDKQK